jgi:outer membrane immunogenic protein
MKTQARLLAASALVAIAPAAAQDAPNYSGPRAELRAGYEFVQSGVRSTQEFGERGVFGDDASNEEGMIGAEIGYDAALSGFVVGGYAGFEYSDANIGSAGRPYTFNTGNNMTVGVRAGIALNPGALLYVKGGYSRGKLKVVNEGPNPALFADYDSVRDGYHIGAGVELPFGTRYYARGDYVYHRYSPFDVTANDTLKFSRHQLVAAVGIRFGGRSYAEVAAPVVVPAPEPMPAATQTCADGSVILATDACPVMTPPQPVAQPERG